MGNKEKRTLEEILATLDNPQQQITLNLQNLIKQIVPQATEIIRRGNITYVLDGKDFVWLTQASGHVDIEFAMGVSLDSSLLRSHGIKEKNKSVRHVEVHDFGKFEAEVARLLHDAVRIWFEVHPKATV